MCLLRALGALLVASNCQQVEGVAGRGASEAQCHCDAADTTSLFQDTQLRAAVSPSPAAFLGFSSDTEEGPALHQGLNSDVSSLAMGLVRAGLSAEVAQSHVVRRVLAEIQAKGTVKGPFDSPGEECSSAHNRCQKDGWSPDEKCKQARVICMNAATICWKSFDTCFGDADAAEPPHVASDGTTLLSAATTGGIFSPCMLHFLGCVFEIGKDVHHDGPAPAAPADASGILHDERRVLPQAYRPPTDAVPDFGAMLATPEAPTQPTQAAPPPALAAQAAPAAPEHPPRIQSQATGAAPTTHSQLHAPKAPHRKRPAGAAAPLTRRLHHSKGPRLAPRGKYGFAHRRKYGHALRRAQRRAKGR